MIPLEDLFSDIIGKAQRGLKISDADLAQKSGITVTQLEALKGGTWNETDARKVAPVLGLKASALVEMGAKTWIPKVDFITGFTGFNTPYEDITVNAYLAWDPATKKAVAFDTGADATPILDFAKTQGITIGTILITHTHVDHILELDRLKEKTGAKAYVGDREPLNGAESFAVGKTFSCGALTIESRLTWGHSKGGITYCIRGLAEPVAVIGDAVFASSMGGGGVSYDDALRTNREQILTLPEETILASGHGPLTRVGIEKVHNPFFP